MSLKPPFDFWRARLLLLLPTLKAFVNLLSLSCDHLHRMPHVPLIETIENIKSFACPGVDVMIKISAIFANFRRKKICVFLKNQCYDQTFA
jgi:hypothetical protein